MGSERGTSAARDKKKEFRARSAILEQLIQPRSSAFGTLPESKAASNFWRSEDATPAIRQMKKKPAEIQIQIQTFSL